MDAGHRAVAEAAHGLPLGRTNDGEVEALAILLLLPAHAHRAVPADNSTRTAPHVDARIATAPSTPPAPGRIAAAPPLPGSPPIAARRSCTRAEWAQ